MGSLLAEAAGCHQAGQRDAGAMAEYVHWTASEEPPLTMTAGHVGSFSRFDDGYAPAEPVDQAILATRKAVFPAHGLMP